MGRPALAEIERLLPIGGLTALQSHRLQPLHQQSTILPFVVDNKNSIFLLMLWCEADHAAWRLLARYLRGINLPDLYIETEQRAVACCTLDGKGAAHETDELTRDCQAQP